MRRIFTFLMAFVFLAGLNAQDVKVTALWDHSVHGTAEWIEGVPMFGDVPAWMGNLTERGMAHFDGKLYIPSRNSNTILVLDALTGNKIQEITIDGSVSGGTYPFNDIAITDNGDIVLCNLTIASTTTAFKVYVLSDDGSGNYASVKTLIEWTSPAGTDQAPEPTFRIGDGFGVFGDVAAGNGYVMTAGNGLPARVFRWDVTNGVAAAEPITFDVKAVVPAPKEGNDPEIGTTPKFWPVSNDLVWIDGHSIMPGLYNMAGELVTGFSPEGVLPQTSGISGVSHFMFKDREFMWAPTTNHATEPKAAFELFEIPATGLADVVSLGIYPEKGMGANTNASYAAPVAIDVQLNKVLLFAMSTNNGIAAFELSIDEATAIGDNEAQSAELYPNPASDRVYFTKQMAEVQLLDMAGKLIKSAFDVNELSVSGLKGIYLVRAKDVDGNSMVKKLIVK